jgi:cation transport regulator
MPYQQISDLPESVKEHLPNHAQEIFLAAFNSAIEQYSEEERAFRVAWGAVKRDYEKGEYGKWHKKPEPQNVQA